MRKLLLAVLAGLSACAVGMTDTSPSQVAHVGPGLSAIEITEDGRGFVALSDRGLVLSGVLRREGGRLTGAEVTREAKLTNAEGAWPQSVSQRDSEGLALLADGTLAIAYEGEHRIAYHAPDGSFIKSTSAPTGPETSGNRGIEALAIAPDGTLFALPESLRSTAQLFARTPDGNWSEVATIPSRAGYAPAGADIGPDGRLYVLERAFVGFGFAARLRSMTVDGRDMRTVLEFAPGEHGNLEGISVWRDAAGHLRATMVEDDNFKSFQRGGIVEYALNAANAR